MASVLNKKLAGLESDFWARAEAVELPFIPGLTEIVKVIYPLDGAAFTAWLNTDAEMKRRHKRMLQIESALPPVHPAFLPSQSEDYRNGQWALHHSDEYRGLSVAVFGQFAAYARSRYDSAGGLLGIALLVYEIEINTWQAQREYIGHPASREELAGNQIDLWQILARKRREAGYPQGEGLRQQLWRQAILEWVRTLWGHEMKEGDLDIDQKMWAQLDKDIAASKPANESKAAAYFRSIYDRYPRK